MLIRDTLPDGNTPSCQRS